MKRRKAIRNAGLGIGAMVIGPSWLSMLQSCQAENRLDWQPEFFSQSEALFIGSLVDVILPRTETPGALDVNVDIFMDRVFARSSDKESKEGIRSEIALFNENCRKKFGKDFSSLNANDQKEVLEAMESSSGKFNRGVWGTAVGEREEIAFYRSIKSMAIWAYFTSEEIGLNVLNYDPIPQDYLGCIPLSEVGNRWSL